VFEHVLSVPTRSWIEYVQVPWNERLVSNYCKQFCYVQETLDWVTVISLAAVHIKVGVSQGIWHTLKGKDVDVSYYKEYSHNMSNNISFKFENFTRGVITHIFWEISVE